MRQDDMRPLFIGLPGAGKTSLSRVIAARRGLEVVATDPLFRVFRALPSASDDPRAAVMRQFLAEAAQRYPDQAPDLVRDAATCDEKGRCALHDSTRFRAYGEDVFRLFEIEMLKWLDAQGQFVGKIVDLSASAPLYPANRDLFAPERGYRVFLIDTPLDLIGAHLVADYETYVAQSRAAGEKKPVRGAYEKAIDDALAASAALDEAARQALILETALAVTRKEEAKRMDRYRAFAHHTLTPQAGQTLDQLADAVEALLV